MHHDQARSLMDELAEARIWPFAATVGQPFVKTMHTGDVENRYEVLAPFAEMRLEEVRLLELMALARRHCAVLYIERGLLVFA